MFLLCSFSFFSWPYRFGIIARFIISTDLPFGTLLTTCPSSLNVSTTRGSWNSVSVTSDGLIRDRDHGNIRVGSTMESAGHPMKKWFFVTIVMACTVFNA